MHLLVCLCICLSVYVAVCPSVCLPKLNFRGCIVGLFWLNYNEHLVDACNLDLLATCFVIVSADFQSESSFSFSECSFGRFSQGYFKNSDLGSSWNETKSSRIQICTGNCETFVNPHPSV